VVGGGGQSFLGEIFSIQSFEQEKYKLAAV
jgi:hypothetical protein